MVEDGKLRVKFTNGWGLRSGNGELVGFTVAGEDRKFVKALATIESDAVVVSHPDVPNPVAARYGWEMSPVCNLFNGAGLPASPFRTDDWELIGVRPQPEPEPAPTE
ncbi:MAG: hypothetical protein O3A46_06840 [Candidatus Poribacteria bacterium]|nr:hypothetical protein [Candidatus Poribacteria bacterium]